MKTLFRKIDDARLLAEIVVDTVRDPLLIVDDNLHILFASLSFCASFELHDPEIEGKHLFVIDNAAWNNAEIRHFLDPITRDGLSNDAMEFSHDFPRIGMRKFSLHARRTALEPTGRTILLLRFEDITRWQQAEEERALLQKRTEELLLQKEVLLEEMQHRIVNSLQIIASILMLKSRAVTSDETRQHLQDAHRRVLAVAAVQRHLHSFDRRNMIEIGPYMEKLCDSLSASMIGDTDCARLVVETDESTIASDDAVSLGLIVTELVINALKYAFPDRKDSALINVRYQVNGTDWKLTVSDNGVGRLDSGGPPAKGGLGTSLVNALAHQLDARVHATSSAAGVTVYIAHATFNSVAPKAA